MQTMALVMMKSGKEYKLGLSEGQLTELYEHPDIGEKRVFLMGMTEQSDDIPWHKLFPGRMLSRVKLAVTPNGRQRQSMAVNPVAPLGEIGYYAGPLKVLSSKSAPWWTQ